LAKESEDHHHVPGVSAHWNSCQQRNGSEPLPYQNQKLQQANLQQRRLWWAEGNRWVNLRITTRALKTIQKKGLGAYAKSLGIDLAKI